MEFTAEWVIIFHITSAGEQDATYQLLTTVAAAGESKCVHPHMSRPLPGPLSENKFILLLQLPLVLPNSNISICASLHLVYIYFFRMYLQNIFTHEVVCGVHIYVLRAINEI